MMKAPVSLPDNIRMIGELDSLRNSSEVLDYQLFQTMDQLIYVTLKNGQIVSPFVTSKQLSGETRLYYPFID